MSSIPMTHIVVVSHFNLIKSQSNLEAYDNVEIHSLSANLYDNFFGDLAFNQQHNHYGRYSPINPLKEEPQLATTPHVTTPTSPIPMCQRVALLRSLDFSFCLVKH